MRYLPLVLAVLFFVPGASAQEHATDRGSFLLDGSLSLSSSGESDGDDRYTSLTINPGLSYFIAPGLALGGHLGFSRFSRGGSAFTSFAVGPQIAYFFGGPASATIPFIAANASYLDSGSQSGFGADLSGGAVFMLARNVGLNAEAFYQAFSYSDDEGIDDYNTNTFGFRGGVTVFVF